MVTVIKFYFWITFFHCAKKKQKKNNIRKNTSKKNEKERRKKKRTNRRIGMLQMAPLFQRPKLALLLLHIHYSYSMIWWHWIWLNIQPSYLAIHLPTCRRFPTKRKKISTAKIRPRRPHHFMTVTANNVVKNGSN